MALKKDLNCPHCKKNIDITYFLETEISKTRRDMEHDLNKKLEEESELLQKRFEEKKTLQENEIIHLKKQVLDERQNTKLLKSKIENQIREELYNKQENINKLFEENLKRKYELKFQHLQLKENEYKKEIQNLNNKVESEENRLKGESQELVIETWLKHEFPIDKVKEIKKGQSGADTLLIVNDKFQSNIGTILIESKRTKSFSNTWTKKLKEDLAKIKSNVGIIVTQAMPTGKDYLHEVDGIWICHYSDYKNLIKVLRKSLLAINGVIKTQEQSKDTKSLIFEYLTSSEYRRIIETIVKSFSNLKNSLNKEKIAMNKIWNEREANIDQVIHNTAAMYGRMKGIAGQSIEDIDILKLTKE